MANTVIGLEITEEGVRAAEVTVGRAPRLVACGSVPLPPGAAKDSEVFDKDAVVLALRQLWSRAGIKGKHVVLGIGSRRILVRDYTTQALRPDLLAQALPYQVQDLLPVPADQAVLDFYPVSQEGDQLTGLLVAAVAETVDELITTVGKAKLSVDVVDLAPFGLARALNVIATPGETVAALHLGEHTTYVVVIRDGVPRFVRIIPMDIETQPRPVIGDGGDEPGPAPVLEDLLETVPPGEPPMRRRSVARVAARPAGMTAAAIDDVVARLGSTLRFYADRAADAPVTRVLLSGAGASVDGLPATLAASLPMPVQVVDLASIVAVKLEMPPLPIALNLVSTVGLALGAHR